MTTSYRTVFGLPPKEAASMARLTKGYPFAFQILGYLKWENDGTIDDILPKFDEELTVYAYEKIWSELSELDRKIVYIISQGVNKTGDIRESLGVSPQLLNTYRKRLMERGVVDGSRHGELTLALPRFEEYINMYCEGILLYFELRREYTKRRSGYRNRTAFLTSLRLWIYPSTTSTILKPFSFNISSQGLSRCIQYTLWRSSRGIHFSILP